MLQCLVQIGDDVAGAQSKDAGSGSGNPTTCEFDIAVTGETTIYIYSTVNGLRFYSIEYVSEGGGQAEPVTTILTKTAILAANPSLPTGSAGVTGPVQWSYDGIGYESAMAAGVTGGVDVLYFYGSAKTAAGVNYLKTSSSIGTIKSVKMVMQAWKASTKFTMSENVGGQKQTVTPVSDEGALTHEFTFSDGNDGTFDFQGGTDDLKIISMEIVYVK